jgi:hypothetical protein
MRLLRISGNTIYRGLRKISAVVVTCCGSLWKDSEIWYDSCQWREGDDDIWVNGDLWNNESYWP